MKRSIGLSQAIALTITAVLGSGILFLPAATATVAGPASILSWMIMILFSFPLAYTFAAMSRSFPDAGGAATFVRMALGEHAGNLVGWFYFLTAAVGQMIVSLTGAGYIGTAFHLSSAQIAWIACSILFISGVSNHFGIRVSGKVSLVLSAILLSLLCTAIVITLPSVRLEHFQPFVPHGWYPVGKAVIMIFWSFFGWEAICNLADRFKHPEKELVRSAMISALVIGVVFLLLSMMTVGSKVYGNSAIDSSPVGVMVHRVFGFGAQLVTAVLALILCIGTVNAFVASLNQPGYALSRDQAFPSWFYHLNHRTGTPTRVVWLVILFAGFGVILTTLLNIHFTQLLPIPNSLGMVVYIFSMAAALKLYNKNSGPWISALTTLIMIGLFSPFLGMHILVPFTVSGMYFLKNVRRATSIKSNKEGADEAPT